MSIQGLAIDSDVESTNTDTLGGSFIKPTGLYPVMVDMAYLSKSVGGAMALNLHLKQVDGDRSIIRQTLWVTSGDKKGNKNYYVGQDGKKRLLPGMIQGDQIALIATGKHLGVLSTEEKTIKLWDFESSAEKPTKVNAVTEMIGKPLLIAVIKNRSNKVKKDSNGVYVDQPEERFSNELDKIFYPDGFSVTEKAAEAAEPLFHKKWADKYDANFINDQYKDVAGTTDADALPEAAVSTDSLFDED